MKFWRMTENERVHDHRTDDWNSISQLQWIKETWNLNRRSWIESIWMSIVENDVRHDLIPLNIENRSESTSHPLLLLDGHNKSAIVVNVDSNFCCFSAVHIYFTSDFHLNWIHHSNAQKPAKKFVTRVLHGLVWIKNCAYLHRCRWKKATLEAFRKQINSIIDMQIALSLVILRALPFHIRFYLLHVVVNALFIWI